MKEKENVLGYENIKTLIKKFSIPSIISMLVNSLYNIVDQIFIGWGVGYLGNGATNIVFPLTMLSLAFALMYGDGTSSYLSLKLGENKKNEASKGVKNGIIFSSILSIIICLIAIIFLNPILSLFGCTNLLRPYAKSYGLVIAIGIPFMMIGTTLNSIIRADGSPKYASASMISGAILNIILDPIFIFVFNKGVQGAALATIISQFVTFILNILYFRKPKNIVIDKHINLDFNIVKKITNLGISSFINQFAIVLVIMCENNLLSKYGKLSYFGAEIPITVLGIVMKINQILNSIIIGLSVGASPIYGYNYGANKYNRVFDCLKFVLKICLIIGIISFLLFQLFPDKLILLFGQGNKKYIEFSKMAFRIYLMLCVFSAIQISSGIFFQAIGKSAKSAIISFSRQIFFLIPSMLILSHFFGIKGVLFAGPVADFSAFILTFILLTKEVKNLKGNDIKIKEDTLVNTNKLNKKVIITISREYGSGGRYIGKIVAKDLGIKYYDRDIIRKAAYESGLSEKFIQDNEQKKINLETSLYNNDNEIFNAESKVINEISNESAVIIGRCANYILKDNKDVYKIFIYASDEDKVNRAVKYYGLNKKNALKEINKINKLREKHYKFYTDSDWKDFSNYDLIINSTTFGIDVSAKIIEDFIKDRDLISQNK